MNMRALFPAGKRYRLMRRPSEPILPSGPRPYRRDCQGRLVTALLDLAGADGEVVIGSLTPWASATFVGARHGVTLILKGDDSQERAATLAESLPEAEFAIAGHLVADLSVEIAARGPDESRLILSILTIEAW